MQTRLPYSDKAVPLCLACDIEMKVTLIALDGDGRPHGTFRCELCNQTIQRPFGGSPGFILLRTCKNVF